MVLEAYGSNSSNSQLRALADRLQGTSGYNDGIALDYLAAIARQAGLKTVGLSTPDGHYRRWSIGDLILSVRHGYPVITLVHYASLPGHAGSLSTSDHYVVVVGVAPQGFVINDPAYPGSDGYHLLLRPDQLLVAWHDAEIQGQAAAFLPPSGQLALMGANLAASGLGAAEPAAASAALPARPTVGPPPPPPIEASLRAPNPISGSPAELATGSSAPSSSANQAARAWTTVLSGWSHPASVATVVPVRPTPMGATDSAVVLASDGSTDPSPLPAATIFLVVVALAIAILKAPTGASSSSGGQ